MNGKMRLLFCLLVRVWPAGGAHFSWFPTFRFRVRSGLSLVCGLTPTSLHLAPEANCGPKSALTHAGHRSAQGRCRRHVVSGPHQLSVLRSAPDRPRWGTCRRGGKPQAPAGRQSTVFGAPSPSEPIDVVRVSSYTQLSAPPNSPGERRGENQWKRL